MSKLKKIEELKDCFFDDSGFDDEFTYEDFVDIFGEKKIKVYFKEGIIITGYITEDNFFQAKSDDVSRDYLGKLWKLKAEEEEFKREWLNHE